MTRIVPIALLCIALAGAALAQGKKMMEVSGPARVLDADVLVVAEKHPPVRLYGIDAPEPLQPCFIEGKAWACNAVAVRTLQLLIEHYDVTCRQVEDTNRRRRGKVYAVCMAGGKDLSEEMVRAGMALAFREQSSDYVAAEEAAKAAGVGMWRGEFETPWDWLDQERYGG